MELACEQRLGGCPMRRFHAWGFSEWADRTGVGAAPFGFKGADFACRASRTPAEADDLRGVSGLE